MVFIRTIGGLLSFSVFLTACGGPASDGPPDGGENRAGTTGSVENEGVPGLSYYLETIPSPCALMTEAVVQDLLKVREVVANPANSGPESSSPRCAYRDGEQLGRYVSIMVVSTPVSTFSSSMPTEQVRALVDQFYGEPGMPYSIVVPGPGAQRFVAQRDDGLTMFVMTGLGTLGGSFDPSKLEAEAAFAVSLNDPARTAEERLVAARNLATAYQSNLINAAKAL